MGRPLFGILILNLNGRRWLPGLYASLAADGYGQKRVYLVDNGSTDGSQGLTGAEYPEVVVLQMPRNLGYCMAYNLAMAVAFEDGCDWVIWQNNDTLVLPGWLDRLAQAAGADRRIGVMGPVFHDWSSEAPNYFMQGHHPDVLPFMDDGGHAPVDCDWVEGSACVVSRACAEAVGPLEPALFIYWEEADFCRRARRLGWRVVIVPGSIVRHYGGGDTSSGEIPGINFNALRKRNQYVFTLCDPDRSFVYNIWQSVHLFLVDQKQALAGAGPMTESWKRAKVFVTFVGGGWIWFKKWARDRRGVHPPMLAPGVAVAVSDLRLRRADSGADRASAAGGRLWK